MIKQPKRIDKNSVKIKEHIILALNLTGMRMETDFVRL